MIGRATGVSDELFDAAVTQAVEDALVRRRLNTVLLLVGDLMQAGSATPDDCCRYVMAWQALQLQHAPSADYRFAEVVLVSPEAVS